MAAMAVAGGPTQARPGGRHGARRRPGSRRGSRSRDGSRRRRCASPRATISSASRYESITCAASTPVGRSLIGDVDADDLDAEPAGRARHALDDLAPVGDEQRADGRGASRAAAGNDRQRRTRHADPAADTLRGQPAIGDPALDGTDRDAELRRDLAGRQRSSGHVAIVAEESRSVRVPGRRALVEEGAEPFLPFGRRALLGDMPHGVATRLVG